MQVKACIMLTCQIVLLLQAIHHTSLTHSLLYGSTAPLLIAVGTLIMRKPISTGKLLLQLWKVAVVMKEQVSVMGNVQAHCATQFCETLRIFDAGEVLGTCLGLVGVILLTRANKTDQQV